MSITSNDITAVILAGGQGRRMGGQDKGLIEFSGRSLAEILIEKLTRQSVAVLVNANRNQAEYEKFGVEVISDTLADFQGPLAGFASAMNSVNSRFILTLPCDSPLLVDDYVQRFIDNHNNTGAAITVAHDGERLQPVHALIRVDLIDSLLNFLQSGERKIDRWYALHDFTHTDFSDCADMFRNINTPQDKIDLQGAL